MALKKSIDLIDITEVHKAALVDCCFGMPSNLLVNLGLDKGLVLIKLSNAALLPPMATCGVVFTK